jgi:hypothetical protein
VVFVVVIVEARRHKILCGSNANLQRLKWVLVQRPVDRLLEQLNKQRKEQ